MLEIGRFNQLRVIKKQPIGVFLEGGKFGEILLPKRYVPDDCEIDDELTVFIHLDSEDRLIATTAKPLAQVGEVAKLKVVAVNRIGAFVDWGLPKELLVPFSEQRVPMEEGKFYLVMIFLDQLNRIAASSRLESFLSDETDGRFTVGQEVSLIITDKTELGTKAVIDNTHWGLLYDNEQLHDLRRGERYRGYIKAIREDKKLDLSLQPVGYNKKRIQDFSDILLDKLKAEGGFLAMNDKTPPEKIYAVFKVSKKVFKQGIGKLYKQRLIVIENTGIRLN